MAKYPPYLDAFGKISEVFAEIKKASVPPKFTVDFISTVLGLKSSSYRAMIPILKKLDFLDQASVPTIHYKEYRDDSKSEIILGKQVKLAYSDLYKAAEYAHKLSKEQLAIKLKTLLGVGDDDKNIAKVVGTFTELTKLCKFDGSIDAPKEKHKEKHDDGEEKVKNNPTQQTIPIQLPSNKTFGISYTINLNLPATTEIEVYNSIFKALKDNLLNE